jgi:ParB-like chromosome segregation protein Spo0J
MTSIGGGEGGGETAHDALIGQPLPLVIDPDFQALIPPLSDEELAQLTANLLADGCIEPLWVWGRDGDGSPPVLLDGHHRHAICRAHGLPFRTAAVPGVRTREEAKIWILRHQVGRRNLPAYVRTELALQLRELIAAQAKRQQGTRSDLFQNSGTRPAPIHTDREVAKLAGVSHDTVHKVRRLAREADEPTKAALRRGERSIHAAHKALRPRGASDKAAGAEPSAASATPPPPCPWSPLHGEGWPSG